MILAPFDLATTDGMLRALALDQWNLAFGFWTGFEGPIGEVQRQRNKTTIHQLSEEPLELVLELTALPRPSCAETAAGRECIEFRMVSRPDVDQASNVIQRLIDKSTTGAAVITAVDVVNEVHSLLERNTMLPHSITLVRSSTMNLGRKGSEEQAAVSERSERSYRFEYLEAMKKAEASED